MVHTESFYLASYSSCPLLLWPSTFPSTEPLRSQWWWSLMEGKWGITLKSHEHPTNPFWPSACWKMEVGEGEIHIMVSISVTVKRNSKTKQKCTHACTPFYPPKERCYRSLNAHQMGFCLSTMAQYKGSSWKHTQRNKLAASNGEQMQWALSDLGQLWKWTCFRWGYLRDSAGITHGSGWRRRQLRLSCPLVTTCFEAGALQEAYSLSVFFWCPLSLKAP